MKIVAVLPPVVELPEPSPGYLFNIKKAYNLHEYFASKGHEFITLSDANDSLDPHLADMSVFICSPFYPAYLTKEKIYSAPKLKLALTAGVGSDHFDLEACAERNITVAEVTGSNVVSVAEHAVMQILILLRNFVGGHQQAVDGEWSLPRVGAYAHDLEGKTVGIFGFGRIGQRVAARLRPFGVKLVYNDPYRREDLEPQLDVEYVSFKELVETSDVITIHAPLTEQTDTLFNREVLNRTKQGAYIVNTARGKIMETNALVDILNSGHLAGYAGDVWYPQPASENHPWRTMPKQAMTIHYSGMTLEAQHRIEIGTKAILNNFFEGKTQKPEDLIVDGGEIVSPSYKIK
ncbi:NAD-dependent formate dehydrogenase [Cytobacillus kochii]